MAGSSKRYDSINGLRTFACIGITMMHVLVNLDFELEGFVFKRFIPSFTNFVFLFMTISAFGMCCGYFEKVLSGNIDLADFYGKRYKRILPFFLILCLLDIASGPELGKVYETIVNASLGLGFIPEVQFNVIGVAWFLGVVFVFYFIFPFFCVLLSDKKRAWFVLGFSYVLHLICRYYFELERHNMLYCLVFFMAGGIIYLYRDRIKERPYVKWVSLILMIVSPCLIYTVGYFTIFMLIFGASALCLAISLEGKNILNNRFTAFLGGISFEVYLSHMLAFRILEKLHLLRLTSNDYVNYFITEILVLAIAITFSVVVKKLIDRFIFGNKEKSK
ncbi:MAG: acyltransferase [Butyrivibrio sp.]|nr:acyltransferase [Butyrivibrio sp.]